MNIGQNIKALRKARGLTQEQLAEAMGLTVGAVSKWESGQTTPDVALLPELADFFDCSLDVLFDFAPGRMGVEETIKELRRLRAEKRFAEAVALTEKALVKYPNRFPLVYQSAHLYKLKGIEEKSEWDHRRALALFDRAAALIDQNRDPEISLAGIRYAQAQIWPFLGQEDKALALLKEVNAEGMYDCDIGMLLSWDGKKDGEALRYLSGSMTRCVGELLRDVIAMSNVFCRTGREREARDLILWWIGVIAPLSPEGAATPYRKWEAWSYAMLAVVFAMQGSGDDARMALETAAERAACFDAAPEYRYTACRFFYGEDTAASYDDMGSSAMDAVEGILRQQEERLQKQLLPMWERIRQK